MDVFIRFTPITLLLAGSADAGRSLIDQHVINIRRSRIQTPSGQVGVTEATAAGTPSPPPARNCAISSAQDNNSK